MSQTQPPHSETVTMQHKIIDAALPDIIFDGWSITTAETAAQKDNIDPLTVKAAFPGGVVDLLDGFADLADAEMLNAILGFNADDMRVRDRVRIALIARFEYLNMHKEAVKDSMKFWLNPLNKPRASKILWRTADRIWTWAGDTSTDHNRYTKRGLLSSVIAAATLVWLNDHSDDMSKTTSFIDGRIANIISAGRFISQFTQPTKE